MTAISEQSSSKPAGVVGLYKRIIKLPEYLPFSLIQLAARVAVAHVFWQSAQSKLASWPVTLQLFASEYNLPLIDPSIAAPLATTAEITGSVLIFLGLFSRLAALMLLGVVSVIQIFVYPENWAEHLLWASLLFLVLTRGAGVFSLDYVAERTLSASAK
ncbi:DoxX family protein [Mesorhizobium sp. M4B.F.Ca.ET.215.01.1.1]|uniref:DoxX family protein n=1 Tax=unclassified Mesorhizobium TaxID=325217 RepID=UPI000FC9D9DF|nr:MULTISPECIES: DoxX family protein [unclassified Mesorhizobium]RUW25806.1 DoxX family protein [Mesorhizobium sp. M4B.F.Ca.ET.013.02.1.1]RVD40040.1 DoxX family protein [Mesorhizobium sp. M4B.F.Ca.ET.019.03.1.1]RWF66104.1 MAG: DoxX family protein [Mesorhizobium sp.]TGQ09440.1 DoxX family protein [Mesorhizobium sp. M4B.F.Ca.ET.215.01.1.1]TGQ31150.1 DoxX family protein [Mesorhizobium sp. M4B.F.Ca.ET.214.01.1.1]